MLLMLALNAGLHADAADAASFVPAAELSDPASHASDACVDTDDPSDDWNGDACMLRIARGFRIAPAFVVALGSPVHGRRCFRREFSASVWALRPQYSLFCVYRI